MDADRRRQRHYTDHCGPIVCFECHPNRSVVASADTGAAAIRVWDAVALGTLAVVIADGSVASLNFLGDLLLTVDAADDAETDAEADADRRGGRQSLVVYDWAAGGHPVARTKTDGRGVRRAAFRPTGDEAEADAALIVASVGRGHAHFWRLFGEHGDGSRGDSGEGGPDGRRVLLLDTRSGGFRRSPQPLPPLRLLCLAFDLAGNAVAGDSAGRLHVWAPGPDEAFEPATPEALAKLAHSGPVTCLQALSDGTLLSVSENCLRIWDTLNDYSLVKEKVLHPLSPSSPVTSATARGADGRLALGTAGGDLLEGSLVAAAADGFTRLAGRAHPPGRVAIATRPPGRALRSGRTGFATVGSDGAVCGWSARRRIWRAVASAAPLTCAGYRPPDGRHLAAGTADGRILVMEGDTGEVLMSCQAGDRTDKAATAASFSPDGRLLAVGSQDGSLRLLSAESDSDGGLVLGPLAGGAGAVMGHASPIACLDWSVDGDLLRTQSDDLLVKFWWTPAMRQASAENVSESRFATESCFVTYSHAAAWRTLAGTGHLLRCSTVSGRGNRLCVCDSSGRIAVYAHPTRPDQNPLANAPAQLPGQSLVAISFAFDDTAIVAACDDGFILLWSLTDSESKSEAGSSAHLY